MNDVLPKQSFSDKRKVYKTLNYFIATVWIVNGFLCKLLDLVPRHELIVSRILGNEHALFLTKVIGISEIFMAIWIISNIKSRINAVIQIIVIGVMNVIEFMLVPDLLLWGKLNLVFAIMFSLLIYYNEFVLNKKIGNSFNMLSFCGTYPFAVEAFFENSYVLTFAVPKESLEGLIPECLFLDTFNDNGV